MIMEHIPAPFDGIELPPGATRVWICDPCQRIAAEVRGVIVCEHCGRVYDDHGRPTPE